jgi:hypothetical protein
LRIGVDKNFALAIGEVFIDVRSGLGAGAEVDVEVSCEVDCVKTAS